MELKNYYINTFRTDVYSIDYTAHLPEGFFFSDVEWIKAVKNIQPVEQRVCFSYSMLLTLIVDQLMYTHYRGYIYRKWKNLTEYPKYACNLELGEQVRCDNPLDILTLPIEKGLFTSIDAEPHLDSFINLIFEETDSFFDEHFPMWFNANDLFKLLVIDQDVNKARKNSKLVDKIIKAIDKKIAWFNYFPNA